MIKLINYFIFNIYSYQIRTGNKNVATIFTSIILVIVLWIILMSVYFLLLSNLNISFPLSVLEIVIIGSILFIILYKYINKKIFLSYGFTESNLGYAKSFIFIITVFLIYLFIANRNRNRIQNDNSNSNFKTVKSKSLEEDIKNWIKH